MNNFELVFSDFIRNNYPQAEVVADGLKGETSFKNADYFFNNRAIIAELKCIEEEKYSVIYKILGKLLQSREIPVFKKGTKIGDALKGHPKEDVIKIEIFNRVTASLEGALEKANRQIRETKIKFNLKDARGAALLVNLDNTALDPGIATRCIHNLIMKKGVGREFRYEELHIIIYISHVHYQHDSSDTTMPFFRFIRKDDLDELDKAFLHEFAVKWTEFMGLPFIDKGNLTSGDVLNFGSFISKEKDFDSIFKKEVSS